VRAQPANDTRLSWGLAEKGYKRALRERPRFAPSLAVQVEEGNAPAVGLYKSLGYQEVFVNEGWAALRPSPDGELSTESVNLVAYSKPVA
jgi:hypothetical protein